MANEPQFIELNPQALLQDLISDYEARVGRTLQPAQVERLVLNAFAYRIALTEEKIQAAALQNLVRFSAAPVLDYLGELVGVRRLPASRAFCTIRFELVPGHGNLVIPAGLRVRSNDGQATFVTTEPTEVLASVNEVDIDVECQSEGAVGNGYLPNTVNTVIDPQAYLQGAYNVNTTEGGGDQESDEELRDRIYLAPSSFSVAGPKNAYKFHAKSASPLIIDVAVLGPEDGTGPGIVEIYPLVANGTTPQQILDAVLEKCSNDKVRPLTDLVMVYSPTVVSYDITVNLTLFTTADQASIVQQVTESLEEYAALLRSSLGKDVSKTKIIQLSHIEGVYSVAVPSPASNIITIAGNQVAEVNTISVNVIGISNG